jgi:hypothetical protein
MNDRELLELAAKAAGIKIKGYYEDEPSLSIKPGPKLPTARWNPLTDDGDALRLVVKLQIDIEWRGGEVWAYRHASADGECFTAIEAAADHDPEIIGTGGRATRRAIVRSAAEIGKAMK